MKKLQWWCYLHTNGSVQAKRYFSREDLKEARESPFVKDFMLPFYAVDRDDAIRQGMEFFGVKPISTWQPMKQAVVPAAEMDKVRANCEQHGLSEEQIQIAMAEAINAPIFKNDKYQVSIHQQPGIENIWPDMVHLSIKRLDKEPIFDWRDMQNIKNDLLGPEFEGVQLFPAESRKVDGANQYHMFCLAEPVRFPFGFTEKLVTSEPPVGGKQRDGA